MYQQEKTAVTCSCGILVQNTSSVVLEQPMPRPKPDVSYKSFSVRVRGDLLDDIRETATREKRSVNAQIELIFEEWLATKKAVKARKGLA